MDLQSFSSIFELFASFSLAYIVINEYSANPFIVLITEKILRRYREKDKIMDAVWRRIRVVDNSLKEIAQRDCTIEPYCDLKIHRNAIDSTISRFEDSEKQMRDEIQGEYSTKMFSYLNCYIFFYCLIILFIGGIYSSNTWVKADNEFGQGFRARIDTSLLIVTSLSFIILLFGWVYDRKKPYTTHEDHTDKLHNGDIFNGYTIAFFLALGICILTVALFFSKVSFVSDSGLKFHNTIIISSIMLPGLNFFAYIHKANRRAKKNKERILQLATKYSEDYLQELIPIDEFIGACSFKDRKLELRP